MLNILVPMAGDGSRFKETGNYSLPKPYLLLQKEFPMFLAATKNLPKDARYIFVVRDDQYSAADYEKYFKDNFNNYEIVVQIGKLDGSVLTTLVAKDLINNDSPLLIADSDQYSLVDFNEFFALVDRSRADGGILTFTSDSPEFSYIKADKHGYIEQIKEKQVISNDASSGLYYWSKGRDYIKYAEDVLKKDIRIKSEFYVSTVYKEALSDNKKFIFKRLNRYFSFGTPNSLNKFLTRKDPWSFESIFVDRSNNEFRAPDIDVDNYLTKLSNVLQLCDIKDPVEIVKGKVYLAIYHPAFWHFLQDSLAQYEVLKQRIPDLKIVFIEYADIFNQVDGKFPGTRFSYIKDLCEYYMTPEEFRRTFVFLDIYRNNHSNVLFEELYFYSDLSKIVSAPAWAEHGLYPKWHSENNEAWIGVHWTGKTGRDPWRKEGVNLMRERFHKTAVKDDKYPKKLYVSRRDAHERHARVMNDPEAKPEVVLEAKSREYDESLLESYFRSKGYEIKSMEGVSYKDQINYFYNADIVAGLAGSGFSNLICARAGTRVIELHVKKDFSFSYEYLAGYLDQEFILTDLRVKNPEDDRLYLSWEEMEEKLNHYRKHIVGENYED